MIFSWLSDGDLGFDLDNDLESHFKVRSIFSNGTILLTLKMKRAENFTFGP